jgi:Fur family ferric uptake transcriptional regulator
MKSRSIERRSLLQELTLRGVRITGQRRILLEIIQQADRHLDAATLLSLAQKQDDQINRATVYRTLELLKKLRLIDELYLMHLNGEKHFYEAKTTVDHIHLACFECGNVDEFTTPLLEQVKAEVSRKMGFQVRVVRLEVGGRCRACCTSTGCDGCKEEICCKDGNRSSEVKQSEAVRLTLAKRTARPH